uniref:hypothetical protein n=1 Tax=Salmonella sp. TaxID=599 RepID=UPI001CD9189A|nr:hypothetical protein [Salmonella sp.]
MTLNRIRPISFNVFEYACFAPAYLVSNNDDTGIGEQDRENQQQHRGKGRLPRSVSGRDGRPTPRFLHGLNDSLLLVEWEHPKKYRQQLGKVVAVFDYHIAPCVIAGDAF